MKQASVSGFATQLLGKPGKGTAGKGGKANAPFWHFLCQTLAKSPRVRADTGMDHHSILDTVAAIHKNVDLHSGNLRLSPEVLPRLRALFQEQGLSQQQVDNLIERTSSADGAIALDNIISALQALSAQTWDGDEQLVIPQGQQPQLEEMLGSLGLSAEVVRDLLEGAQTADGDIAVDLLRQGLRTAGPNLAGVDVVKVARGFGLDLQVRQGAPQAESNQGAAAAQTKKVGRVATATGFASSRARSGRAVTNDPEAKTAGRLAESLSDTKSNQNIDIRWGERSIQGRHDSGRGVPEILDDTEGWQRSQTILSSRQTGSGSNENDNLLNTRPARHLTSQKAATDRERGWLLQQNGVSPSNDEGTFPSTRRGVGAATVEQHTHEQKLELRANGQPPQTRRPGPSQAKASLSSFLTEEIPGHLQRQDANAGIMTEGGLATLQSQSISAEDLVPLNRLKTASTAFQREQATSHDQVLNLLSSEEMIALETGGSSTAEGAVPTSRTSAPDFPFRLAQRLVVMASKGEYRTRLNLHPPELGRIHIEISLKRNRLSAVLVAETQTVKELMETHLTQLRQHLAQQDLHLDDFKVTVGVDTSPFRQLQQEQSRNQEQGEYAGSHRGTVPEVEEKVEMLGWSGGSVGEGAQIDLFA